MYLHIQFNLLNMSKLNIFLCMATFGILNIPLRLVAAETYIIVPTDNGSCLTTLTDIDHTSLDETETCLTLTQYANVTYNVDPTISSNTTLRLIFIPGNHTLESYLRIQNVKKLVLQVAQTTLPVAVVTCRKLSRVWF